jgi:chromosome segregation ATPase
MSDELISDAQAVDTARMMKNHFRVFEHLEQVLINVENSKTRTAQAEEKTASLQQEIDSLQAELERVTQQASTQRSEIITSLDLAKADQESQLIALESGLQAKERTVRDRMDELDTQYSARLFTLKEEVEQLEAQRDHLVDIVSQLVQKKKAMLVELGQFLS